MISSKVKPDPGSKVKPDPGPLNDKSFVAHVDEMVGLSFQLFAVHFECLKKTHPYLLSNFEQSYYYLSAAVGLK